MKRILLAFALTCLISTGTFADEEAASPGKPGDPGQVSRTIVITMVDNRFKPSEIDVKQGETIKFMLENAGTKKHEMVIGTPEELDKHAKLMKKFPDMEHPDEPNIATVDPGKPGTRYGNLLKPVRSILSVRYPAIPKECAEQSWWGSNETLVRTLLAGLFWPAFYRVLRPPMLWQRLKSTKARPVNAAQNGLITCATKRLYRQHPRCRQ